MTLIYLSCKYLKIILTFLFYKLGLLTICINISYAQEKHVIELLPTNLGEESTYQAIRITLDDSSTQSKVLFGNEINKKSFPFKKFAKIYLKNSSNIEREILINWGQHMNLMVYDTRNTPSNIQNLGLIAPHSQKPIISPIIKKNYSKYLVSPQITVVLFICLQDIHPIPQYIEIEVSDDGYWKNNLILHRFIQGLFLGFMGLFLIFILVFYLSNFISSYLYLLLYVVGMTGRFLAFYGFLKWFSENQVQDYMIWITFSQTGAVFLILFIRHSLLIPELHKGFNRLLLLLIYSRIIIFLGLIYIYFNTYDIVLLTKIVGFLDLFTLPIAFWVLIHFSKQGLFARYLLISTLSLLLGLGMGTLTTLDFFHIIGEIYSLQIGITSQLFFICLGMGVQIRAQINRDRKSQAKVLVLQKEITTRLELKVQERTEALVKANKEITLRNDELNKQQEAIISINNHLESLVVMRTAEITKQNDSLRNYAYFNAHKVRGPLARILGLIYLTKIDPIKSLEDFNILIHQLDICANELDNTIREINEILSEDDEESPDQ